MDASEGSHGTDDRTRHGFFGREALDMGALLLAAGAAHVLVLSLGHSDGGVRALITGGALLLAVSALHRWHRYRIASPRRGRGRRGLSGPCEPCEPCEPCGDAAPAVRGPMDDRLWGMRVTVADVPGGLAALTSRLAVLGVDIRLMQVHPGGAEATDEFFVSAPAHVGEESLCSAVQGTGVRDVVVRPADVHELSDTTSRTLTMVSALVDGATALERSLAALTAAQDVGPLRHVPDSMGAEGLSGTTMTLPAPDGGVLVVRRANVPFTAVEFARCRALAQVAASLHERARHR